jgi:two-component system phosphate regulon sensor histidine kinase PhoR
MKNPTPRQIAIGVAAFIAIVCFLSLYIADLAFDHSFSWYCMIIPPVVSLIGGYLILVYALELFIYRKIKLVYKSIAKTKTTKEITESKMDMKSDIIRDVEDEAIKTVIQDRQTIEQLKRMEEYRRQFLGDVSHELKTPIFHIQGYIETLLDGGLQDQSINLRYLKKAAKNAERLNAIVEDLETIALIEDGKLNMDEEEFNLWELVNEVFDQLAGQAKHNDISLKFKKGFINPCFIRGDRERIRQIFVNLITNAIKYGRPGGKVTVGDYDMDEKYLIEVCDNGIGIDEEHLPRIFERFYRVDKSRSREKGGTGLGLSIVKHILEAHKQTINVRSTPGEGTTFTFTLDKV